MRARSQLACTRNGSVELVASRKPRRPRSCPGTPATAASPQRLAEARYPPRTARARFGAPEPTARDIPKISVGAADVEEASIRLDSLKYRLALGPPADSALVEARLLPDRQTRGTHLRGNGPE